MQRPCCVEFCMEPAASCVQGVGVSGSRRLVWAVLVHMLPWYMLYFCVLLSVLCFISCWVRDGQAGRFWHVDQCWMQS